MLAPAGGGAVKHGPMSLRLRVVLAIALVLIASSAVGAALAGWQAKQVLHEELTAALAGGRQTAAGAFEDLPRSDDPGRDLRRLVRAFDGDRHLRATLTGEAGATLAVSHPIPVVPAPAWFAGAFQEDLAPVRLAVPTPGTGQIILSPVFANDVAAIWAEFIDLIGVLTASFLVGSALVWLSVGRALRPLSSFSAAFLRIGSGDYGAKVREEGPLELVRLGRGVNQMAARLAAMQARNRGLEDQLLTLQDEERADLARDLHDEIGPHLFAVNVDAAMAQRLIEAGRGEEAAPQVRAIQAAVAHMQALVRDILGRLRPTQLIELGLGAAVADLVAFWRARHRDIAFEVRLAVDDDRIDEALRETLYRVIQEGLNNAVRHGRPSHIEVDLTVEAAGEVVLRISDDGAGGERGPGPGFGLIGMRERVAAAGGDLTIAGSPAGGGWTLLARIPTETAAAGVSAA
jgi:two-component system sensor histidine kinase UhpB